MAKKWIAPRAGGIEVLEFVDDEVPPPAADEVTIRVGAAGMNPADYKHLARVETFPVGLGYEVAGVITAVGADARLGAGNAAVGVDVLAFRVDGGYASQLNVT